MLKSMQSTEATVKRHPDAMHGLLLGPEEAAVSQNIIAWIHLHS